MQRVKYGFFVLLLLLIPAVVAAQDVPQATQEPAPPPALPAGVVPIPTAAGGAPGAVSAPVATVEAAPAATELAAPADESVPPPAAIDTAALPTIVNARNDLELLAGQYLGAERPLGWSGSLDINDPQILLLARLDLELLAGTLLLPDQRPAGWFGALPGPHTSIARDIRHDLELLADALGVVSVRPPGWIGDDPLMRCSRAVQALVSLLERSGGFVLSVDSGDPNFCTQAEIQASQYAEANVLAAGQVIAGKASAPGTALNAGAPGSAQIDGEFAVGFLDRFARQPVGTIPLGEAVTAVARSYTQFSRMALVRGAGFEVFVDYRDTTLTDEAFTALPDVDSLSTSPSCSADWCTRQP